MTDPRLDEIEGRLNAATPGPWANYGNLGHEVYAVNAHDDDEPGYVAESIPRKIDAEFIANAPADVAYLLAELRKAHAAVRAARFVVSVREAELLKLKGPCSNNDCTLHYAHSGPCNEDRTQARAAVAAANGDGERAASQPKVIPIPRSAVTNLYRTRKMTAKAMTIPDEAVEAAHKAWREQAALRGSIFEYNLQAALEAAAPYLRAQALDDAADKLGEDTRPTPQLYAQWLRIRAVAERGEA